MACALPRSLPPSCRSISPEAFPKTMPLMLPREKNLPWDGVSRFCRCGGIGAFCLPTTRFLLQGLQMGEPTLFSYLCCQKGASVANWPFLLWNLPLFVQHSHRDNQVLVTGAAVRVLE